MLKRVTVTMLATHVTVGDIICTIDDITIDADKIFLIEIEALGEEVDE